MGEPGVPPFLSRGQLGQHVERGTFTQPRLRHLQGDREMGLYLCEDQTAGQERVMM